MINLVILTSQCLKDNVRSLQKKEEKKKKITILSVFYLSMFRLKRHCYINRNHNNKNWTYLFQTYVKNLTVCFGSAA